jgi:hypothetical protein
MFPKEKARHVSKAISVLVIQSPLMNLSV